MDDTAQRLKTLRQMIDGIDDQILSLLNQRAQAAGQIGHLKTGVLYRPEREAQILQRLKDANDGPLPGASVVFLFREIMSACLAYERPVSVACLGPQGSFSEAAVVRHFGHAAERRHCDSLGEIFRVVEADETDFAVVPVENSTEGAVGIILDQMVNTPLQACGEVMLPIHHQLLVRNASLALSEITHVYSHSQSLGQCHHWLDAHLPRAQRIPVTSNSEAARLVGSSSEAWAAIAGDLAAEPYGLNPVARRIEDQTDNTTRFLVFGHLVAQPSGKDKTSLVVGVENRPGAIHALLTPLAEEGVSMSRLESRPARTHLWSYVFYIDLEGHQSEERVARVLREIKKNSIFVKVLGSYPAMVSV
ncbi:prephenate dehydratase [Ferrovum sp.]|uniref:prephenate dehydratase n=1 Tax=Ferrovum sp. TaxID=2609467 RepID=UPI00261FE8D9|nr:prephenate dehydratase [Ferrovum sp.]